MTKQPVELIERARRYVATMPAAVSGSGGHDATFHVACVLVQGFCLSPDQALEILRDYNDRCSPPWSERELIHKLKGADRSRPSKGRGFLLKGKEWTPSKEWREYHNVPEPRKAAFDAAKLARFSGSWSRVVDLVWLANRSAVDPSTVTPASFLEILYPGEKIAVITRDHASTIGDGVTIWPATPPPERGPEPKPCGVWFLAQPIDGGYHPTDEGDKMSCRNHRAVTSWRYLVIESDEADTRQWLGALAQLPLRIAALYSSGGRSVHALVRVDAATKDAWDLEKEQLKPALVTLGADRRALSAVRLTRLPGCLRHGKMIEDPSGSRTPDGKIRKIYQRFTAPKLQKLLYLNPRPDLAPLVDYFPRRDVVSTWTKLAEAGVSDTDETGWLERGLEYYAGVSREVAVALEELKGGDL